MKKIIVVILVLALCLSLCACDASDYKKAMKLFESGEYQQAKVVFTELADYQDAEEMVKRCDYETALRLIAKCQYEEALALLQALGDYKDAIDMEKSCSYNYALDLMDSGDYEKALPLLQKQGDYRDSEEKLLECVRVIAEARAADGDLHSAVTLIVEYSQYNGAVNIFLDLLAYEMEEYTECIQEANDLFSDYIQNTWMSQFQSEINKTAAGQSINVPPVDESDGRIIAMRKLQAKGNEIIGRIKTAYTEENLAAFDSRIGEQMPAIYENADKINNAFNTLDTYTNCMLIYSKMGNTPIGASAKKVINAIPDAMIAMAEALLPLEDCYVQ